MSTCLNVLHGLVQLEKNYLATSQRQDHLSLIRARLLDLLLAGCAPLLWRLTLHDDAQAV